MAVQGTESLVWFSWLGHCGFRASETPPRTGEITALAPLPPSTDGHGEPPRAWLMGFWKPSAQPWREALARFRFNPSCGHTLQRQQHVGKEKLPGQFGQPVGL